MYVIVTQLYTITIIHLTVHLKWEHSVLPAVAQWVQEPALLQLQPRFEPWSRNIYVPQPGGKKKKKKKEEISMVLLMDLEVFLEIKKWSFICQQFVI